MLQASHSVFFSKFWMEGGILGRIIDLLYVYVYNVCAYTHRGKKRNKFHLWRVQFKKGKHQSPPLLLDFWMRGCVVDPNSFLCFWDRDAIFLQYSKQYSFFSSFEYGVIFSVRPFLSRCQAEHTQLDDDENHICTFSFIPMDDTAFYIYRNLCE